MAVRGLDILAAGAGLVGAFTLLSGPNTVRQSDELRGMKLSNLEMAGHFVGDQPYILHDVFANPLGDGEFSKADGLLIDAEAKAFISTVALGGVATGVTAIRRRRSS